MKLLKEHIFALFGFGLLLIGVLFLSNNLSIVSSWVYGELPSVENHIQSEEYDSGQKHDSSPNQIKVVLSEQKESKDSNSGMNSPAFTKQAHPLSLLPVKKFPAIDKFYTRISRYAEQEGRVLCNSLPTLVFEVTPPPLISGIAINAP